MSVQMEIHREAVLRRQRLWNPINAVPDLGIDLKRPREIVDIRSSNVPSPELVIEQLVTFKPMPIRSAPKSVIKVAKQGHSVKRIARAVASFYQVRYAYLISSARTQDIVRPRFAAFLIAKILTRRSLPDLGRQMGNRDHTTALHAIRKAQARSMREFSFGSEVAVLECVIRKKLQKRQISEAA